MNSLCKSAITVNSNKNLSLLHRVTKYYSSNVVSNEKIEIPKRIQRGSTDILNALASTVNKDMTAPHYKYHDDPYLIPMSNIGKRTFAMAQEAGRKAAKWIRQEHADMFKHTVADPPIKAFIPQVVFTETSEVTLDSLRSTIRDVEVSDAVLVYNLLIAKGEEIPVDLKQSLLEFICFYNQENTLSDEFIEERWFRQSTTGKERQRKTWKDNDLAEKIFYDIEPKTAVTYCTIIRGMCKYFQVEKAWALYQESMEKGIEIDVTTYNAILQVVCFIKESSELRWELIQELLSSMSKQNLKPNIGTLNAVLSTISGVGTYQLARGYTLKTLTEFKNLGIEPSLASWYYVLTIFCRERGPVSHVLIDIMNEIEGKQYKIQDIKDTFFFVTAMDVCRNHLLDKAMAKRIDTLLHLGNNYDLIGDSFKESIYYRHYFGLLCQTESLEKFMETYNSLVPNIYIPEPGIMEEILKAIDTNGALEYIPQMWSHMIIFDHLNRESLLTRTLRIMIENVPNPNIQTQLELPEKFTSIAWDIWNKIEDQYEGRTQKLAWTGPMLGDIMELCCRTDDIEKASLVFEKLDKNQHKILGAPSFSCLSSFVQLCIRQKQPTKAMNCLQYCVENSLPESIDIGKSIVTSLTLNETQISKVVQLVGKDVLEKNTKIVEDEKQL